MYFRVGLTPPGSLLQGNAVQPVPQRHFCSLWYTSGEEKGKGDQNTHTKKQSFKIHEDKGRMVTKASVHLLQTGNGENNKRLPE